MFLQCRIDFFFFFSNFFSLLHNKHIIVTHIERHHKRSNTIPQCFKWPTTIIRAPPQQAVHKDEEWNENRLHHGCRIGKIRISFWVVLWWCYEVDIVLIGEGWWWRRWWWRRRLMMMIIIVIIIVLMIAQHRLSRVLMMIVIIFLKYYWGTFETLFGRKTCKCIIQKNDGDDEKSILVCDFFCFLFQLFSTEHTQKRMKSWKKGKELLFLYLDFLEIRKSSFPHDEVLVFW